MKIIYQAMSVRQTIKTYLLWLSCIASVAGTASCNSNNEPKLQQVQLVNMQLEQFALSVKDHPELSALRFSINNTSPQGQVENVEPLPYGAQLNKVKLQIVPAVAIAKVEVAFGEDGAFADWSADREYQIGSDVSVLRLRLSLRTEQHDYYEYVYRVQLRRYKFDPETIDWVDTSVSGLPHSVADAYMYAHTRVEDVLILRSSASGNEYYSHKGGAFIPLQITGLAAGERIEQGASYEDILYIYTSSGKIYRLSGTAWHEVSVGGQVRALLGVLAPRKSHLEPRLALIVEQGGMEVFASYADGKLSTRGLQVPASFPRRDVHAFGANKTYIGSSLTLIGEQLEGDMPVQSSWYTTGSAEDWLQLSRTERPDRRGARPSSVLSLGGTLYRLETVGGLNIYTSEDQGRSWKKNGDKALPEGISAFASVDILGYPAPDNTIQLLRGVSVSSAGVMSLLKGRPKKYDL